MAIIFGKDMRNTRLRKLSVGICHTILKQKKAKSTFVVGFSILPNEQ
jgi:hypothetical protein